MHLKDKIPFDTIMTSLLSYSTDLPLIPLPESVETDQTWYPSVHQYLSHRDWKLENDPFREDITESSLHPHFLQVCFDLVEHKIFQEFQDYLREMSSASM